MNAGRELDYLIAEKVMGWTRSVPVQIIGVAPGSKSRTIPEGWAEPLEDGSFKVHVEFTH